MWKIDSDIYFIKLSLYIFYEDFRIYKDVYF